jgi:hypothetical protein
MKKKLLIAAALLALALFSASAQGLYFDIGLGAGWAWTKLDGDDVADIAKSSGGDFTQVGVDLGLKAGYGPIANLPLYAVGTFGAAGHRLYDSKDYLQFNSFILGPGVIFYPIPLVQLAADVGYSFVGNSWSLNAPMYESKGGFAWDVSAAANLGIGKSGHGVLLGLKYFAATNTLKTSNAKQAQSGLSVFVRYAFRHQPPRLNLPF